MVMMIIISYCNFKGGKHAYVCIIIIIRPVLFLMAVGSKELVVL